MTDSTPLSPREIEMLQLVADGWRARTIATQLAVSPRAVSTYLRLIRAKLGVPKTYEAVAQALRAGWIR